MKIWTTQKIAQPLDGSVSNNNNSILGLPINNSSTITILTAIIKVSTLILTRRTTVDKNRRGRMRQMPLLAPAKNGKPRLRENPCLRSPLTPSDVGKLNRLVIPKQHAEKYFPLGGGGDAGDKGLLLSFEDESGKCWSFRYSYWNSSQSYVLTKGWSRYVKEKRLDAGDIILFERHRTDGQRLFIGWRRRGATVAPDATSGSRSGGGGSGGGGRWSTGLYSGSPHPYPPAQPHGITVPHQPDCLHAGSVVQNPVGNSRTLRLFGVNMECQLNGFEPSTLDDLSTSSHGQARGYGQQQQQQFNYSQAYSSNRHNQMDITFLPRCQPDDESPRIRFGGCDIQDLTSIETPLGRVGAVGAHAPEDDEMRKRGIHLGLLRFCLKIFHEEI
ncbi:hypothetical protein Patl1_32648 [Pistacia atlantica]|uniref:Uncharacterized protein n=1 Tax=Pistacia atlantica TaxID=434234 RepID=A0ACC1AQN0_9ROSI|nr:hypothetical protein Patl1_32648 [Pistacia atlantica]